MKELNEQQVSNVSGGGLPLLIPVIKIAFNITTGAAGAYSFGYALGQLAKPR